MSFGKSDSVCAGLSSAPDASEHEISSIGLRGVVKAGFRNAGAGGLDKFCCGVNNERAAFCDFEGLAKGFGRC